MCKIKGGTQKNSQPISRLEWHSCSTCPREYLIIHFKSLEGGFSEEGPSFSR